MKIACVALSPKVTRQKLAPAPKPSNAKSITITARTFREAVELLVAAWPDGAR